ncbi:transposase [Anabaena sphaerica FACHB-251]|uniref:Transposase n=1 Tax=Anabaena sphaerica FACHB-251 TaxID=2692883 RepID=A0A926WH68_9NOST|nr:transposase [Anabaena sphaerica FACHB-251]
MRKLTDSDKQEILKLYRETAETTSTLAERYGVSNSTISRLLKSTLPEEDYEYLVSLKRAARTPEGRAQVSYEQLPLLSQRPIETPLATSDRPSLELPKVEPQKPAIKEVKEVFKSEQVPPPIPAIRRVKTRSSATEKPLLPVAKEIEIVRHKPTELLPSIPRTILEDETPVVNVIADMFDDDLLDESDDLEDLDDDLYEDEEDFEDDDFEEPTPLVTRLRSGEAAVQVLPLSVAHLPKTCYLVIDRSAELITRPLKDFGDLGPIPTIETQQKTLPVFDNHRVAKRFSTKRDRVIKVPDSRMLHKASTHLQAKGITRLLIDGQVYSLSMV